MNGEKPKRPEEQPLEQLSEQKPEELSPEKADIWSPVEYVKRTAFKEKSVSEDIIEQSLTRLNVPLQEVAYQESDTVDISADEIKFNFSYSLLDEESKPGIEKYVHSKSTGLEGKPYEPFIADLNNWKRLDSLTFKVGEEDKDVFTSLPKNSKIFFCPTREDFHGSTPWVHNYFTDETEYNLYIIGDITCPRSIATLMHEIGHVFDYENKKKGKGSSIKGGAGDYHYKTAEKIRSERTASAFAFKFMKPFLKDKQLKQDVINYLKGYALSSYNWEAREIFEKEEVKRPYREREATRAMADWEVEQRELENFNMWEDFEEWKKTHAYKQWKLIEENKDLDEFEEFGAWRMWIEETNYDYSKDLKKE